MAYTKTNWVNGTTPLNDKNMNKIENALENLDTNISKSTDEYSSTRTYSIGELVIYNNKLYKANQDITTAEAFNSSHWTEVTLLSDVNEIKSVVNNNADNLNKLNDAIDQKANSSDVYTKEQVEEMLGNVQIINIQSKILAVSDLAAGGITTKSDTFTEVEGADGYIAMQQNNNWLIPTGIEIKGNTLSCILLNPFTSTKSGNCSFIILAYKNK